MFIVILGAMAVVSYVYIKNRKEDNEEREEKKGTLEDLSSKGFFTQAVLRRLSKKKLPERNLITLRKIINDSTITNKPEAIRAIIFPPSDLKHESSDITPDELFNSGTRYSTRLKNSSELFKIATMNAQVHNYLKKHHLPIHIINPRGTKEPLDLETIVKISQIIQDGQMTSADDADTFNKVEDVIYKSKKPATTIRIA